MKNRIIKSTIILCFAICFFSIFIIDNVVYRLLLVGGLLIGSGLIYLYGTYRKYQEIKIYEKKYLYPKSGFNTFVAPIILIVVGIIIIIITHLKEIGFKSDILYILLLISVFLLLLIQMIRNYLRDKKIYNDSQFVEINATAIRVRVKNDYNLPMIRILGVPFYSKSCICTINYFVDGRKYTKNFKSNNVIKKGDNVKIKVNKKMPDEVYLDQKPNIKYIVTLSIFILFIVIFIFLWYLY